tara:strand:+ start:4600 stop:4959 length:360 start_codon:yes stop_codon:yes gene_type:complete
MQRHDIINEKIIIGLAEEIKIYKNNKRLKSIDSKIDTGATKSSIDSNLASELNLGPIIKTKIVKSAHGNMIRPVIELEIEIAKKLIKSEFTLADRRHLKFKALIGQNILKQGFLINPEL